MTIDARMGTLTDLLASSIGNAKIAGMDVDLNMNSNQYSIALVVFFGESHLQYPHSSTS
jgi:hypothetical protein